MIIIGCDLHTRSEQIAMLNTETGELEERRLEHEDGEAREFYAGLKEPALVGIESTGYTRWFADMLAELGHELVVGEAGKIRAKETRGGASYVPTVLVGMYATLAMRCLHTILSIAKTEPSFQK